MLGNWIYQTTTTTGTGNLTLSAVSGFPTLSTQFAVNDLIKYQILDDTTGAPIESGIGFINGTGELVRQTPQASYVGTTYTEVDVTAVNLPSGTKRVICAAGAGTLIAAAPAAAPAVVKGYGDAHTASAVTTSTLTVVNRAAAVPFIRAVDKALTGIAFRNNSSSAGTSAKIGLYTIGEDGLPDRLIAETETVSLAGVVGTKTALFAAPVNPPERFFVVFLCDAAIQHVTTIGVTLSNCLGVNSSFVPVAYLHKDAGAGLVFPTDWTTGVTYELASTARPLLIAVCQ
jgi:hypothetical protein